MSNRIKISVVMPSFNEEGAISVMIDEIRKNTQAYDTEIVVVDSSMDRTAQIALEKGARVITEPPRGHGIALRTAIQNAKHDIVITTDCDNTYPMDYIPRLVDLITKDGYDLISCNRLTRQLGKEMPMANRAANWGFATLVRVLYGAPVHDVSTGMFAIGRRLKEAIRWETNYSLPCEIIVRTHMAGFRHREIDIPYKIRIGEVTLNRWRSGKAYLRCILNYRFKLGIRPDLL